MKPKLAVSFFLFTFASFAHAEPIQITAQWKGAAVRESAQSKLQLTPLKVTGEGVTEPVTVTTRPAQKVIIEVIKDFVYPTMLAFPKTPGAPVQQTERDTRNTGMTVEITATRDGEQIVFHGKGIMTRLAATAMAESNPPNQPSVASTTFVSRECTFAGRAPVGTPVKLNTGEKGIDAGELTLTFATAK